MQLSPTSIIQIHGFSDLRINNGQIFSCHLLAAKTRVAPLKRITIPKLELCGAVLLVNLLENLLKTITFEYELFMWTDSSIVLGWLQKPPQLLKTFVANRITKLLTFSPASSWKHVKTEDNPADLGTRGSLPMDLIESNLWWHGPSWLSVQQEAWPEPRIFDPTDLETKKISTFHLTTNDLLISRFSSFTRALRVMSYVLRVFQNPKSRPKTLDISTKEVTNTKYCLIRLSQQHYFYREYDCLKQKHPINNKSNILTLTPFFR